MNSGDKKLSNEVDSTQNDKAEDDNIEIDEKIIESKPKNCYNQIVDDEEDNDGIKFVIYKQKKPKNESDQSAPKIVRTEQERRLFNSLCQVLLEHSNESFINQTDQIFLFLQIL